MPPKRKKTPIQSISDDDDETSDNADDLTEEEMEDTDSDQDDDEDSDNEDDENENDEDDENENDEDDENEDDIDTEDEVNEDEDNEDEGEDNEEEDEDNEEEDDEEEDDDEDDDEEEDDEDDDEEEDDEDDDEEEDDEDDEEDDEEKKRDNSKSKIKFLDLLENKKGKLTSIDYYTKYLCQRPIKNIKDMFNGSVKNEIEIKDKASDKNKPFFKNVAKKWGWKQEVMLLDGIKTNGLFNWELIAEQLSKQSGKKFKAEEVKNHYYQYYYNGTLGQVWDYKLEEKPLEHFDHTDPVVGNAKKYLPQVSVPNLREIKFLPHREDFEEYPFEEIELMLTRVDFSSFYMNYLKEQKIDQEMRDLQLVIVDAYRKVVADRMKMYKFMQDFKLIEQFFLNMQNKKSKKCEVDQQFTSMRKFIHFFGSPHEFTKFYLDCLREKLLKLEIARLYKVLATKKKIDREPEMQVMLQKRAPSFLDVGLLLDANKDFILHKSKKRKKKFKFTKRKRTR